jgi:hypothetical protein
MALQKEERPVSGFDSIRIEMRGEATITQGESESLVIEADPSVLTRLKSEVSNGRLELGLYSWLDMFSLIGHPTIRYYITVKDLRSVNISGSGKVVCGPITTDRLRLKVSGSGEFSFENLQTALLEVDFSGSARAVVAGTARTCDIEISGSGSVRASDLQCEEARVHISGSGSTQINVTQKLDVNISGSGEVLYQGQPAIQHRISGSGSVRAA